MIGPPPEMFVQCRSRANAHHWAEQLDGLIDKVRTEVEQYPAADTWVGKFSPAPLGHRPKTVEVRFEAVNSSDGFLGVENRQELRIPPPVLERENMFAGRLGGSADGIGIRGGSGQRFVDHGRQPMLKGGYGEGQVGQVCPGHHHEVEITSSSPNRRGRIHDFGSREVRGRLLAPLGVGGQDRGDL